MFIRKSSANGHWICNLKNAIGNSILKYKLENNQYLSPWEWIRSCRHREEFRMEPWGTPAFRGQIEEAKASKKFEKEWPLNKEKKKKDDVVLEAKIRVC